MNRHAGSLMMALSFCAASPVLAEEMLYCTDTEVIGFKWDSRGVASSSTFAPERYTIKVASDTERFITRTVGDTAGVAFRYECERPISAGHERLVCSDAIYRWEPGGSIATRTHVRI